MKTILVPTDFSPCADIALSYALKLAQRADAEIILIHACDLLESEFSDYKFLINEHNELIKNDLYGRLRRLKFYHEDTHSVRIKIKLYEGDNITECILNAAEDNHADVIVMGTQGAANLKNKILGSNAADVINKSEVPVLTIPCTYQWVEPEKFLIAIEDMYEDAETLKPVFEMAHLYKGEVYVAIFTEEEEAADVITHTRAIHYIQYKLKKAYKEAEIEVVNISGRDFQETMMQYISEKQINLLSMITHKRGFWQNIFNNSMTQKMSYHATVPLLSLHSVFK
jgi:nucleotide-binding universal stress UspA family protein